MGIDDPYLAFCFDETIEYILMQRYVDKNGQYKWKVSPSWKGKDNKQIPKNNSELITEMQSFLKRYK